MLLQIRIKTIANHVHRNAARTGPEGRAPNRPPAITGERVSISA